MTTLKTLSPARNFFAYFLVLILSLASFMPIGAQSYAVYNATSTVAANGIYQPDGTFNGRPKYTNGTHTLFNTPGQYMDWAIVPNGTSLSSNDVANSPYLYSTKIEAETPPFRAWHAGGNTTGLPGENIIVTPINSFGYSVHSFVESEADNGAIKDTVVVYLYTEGITLTGDNREDFIVTAKAEFTDLPSGLNGKLIRTSDSTLLAILDGTAEFHTMLNNTSVGLIFNNSAVSNNDISGMMNASFYFGLVYQSPYHVEGSVTSPNAAGRYTLGGMFNEYPWFYKENYYLCTKSCNPKWIIRSESNVHPLYSTQIETEYPHNREWHVGGFFYTMGDPLVVGMENSILYENYSMVESDENNGTYSDSLKIRYYHPVEGNTFSGAVNDDFIDQGKVSVINLPDGLGMEIRKYDDTTLYAHFTAAALSHGVSDNIQDLMVEFDDSAFDGPGVFSTNNLVIDSLNVVNMAKYVLVDTSNFPREVNGVYSAFDMINDRVAYCMNNEYYIVYRNTPPNCVWGVMRAGDQNAFFSSGIDQDIPPAEGWVKGDYSGTITATIEIFPLQPWLSYMDLLIEESQEDPGSVTDTMMIWLNNPGDVTFNGGDQVDFISEGFAEIVNLPAGLSASLVKESDQLLKLVISGEAEAHTSDDNINNFTIRFFNQAFSNNDAGSVKFSTIFSGKISYNNITGLPQTTAKDKQFRLFPNPSDGIIYIEIRDIRNARLEIYNVRGGLLYNKDIEGTTHRIDLSSFREGVYFISIRSEDFVTTRKILKL